MGTCTFSLQLLVISNLAMTYLIDFNEQNVVGPGSTHYQISSTVHSGEYITVIYPQLLQMTMKQFHFLNVVKIFFQKT